MEPSPLNEWVKKHWVIFEFAALLLAGYHLLVRGDDLHFVMAMGGWVYINLAGRIYKLQDRVDELESKQQGENDGQRSGTAGSPGQNDEAESSE